MKQYSLYDGIIDEMAFDPASEELVHQLLKDKINAELFVHEDKIALYAVGNPVKWAPPKFEIGEVPMPTLDAFGFAVSLNGEPIPAHELHRYVDIDTNALKLPMDLVSGGGLTITYTAKSGEQSKSKPVKNKPHWVNLNEKKRRHRF